MSILFHFPFQMTAYKLIDIKNHFQVRHTFTISTGKTIPGLQERVPGLAKTKGREMALAAVLEFEFRAPVPAMVPSQGLVAHSSGTQWH